MSNRHRVLAIAILLGVAATGVLAQQNARPVRPRADVGKSLIERPVKQLVGNGTPAAVAEAEQPAGDVTKRELEAASRRLLAAAGALDNPKVQPGKVRWHRDFAAARQAAARSGKPVLLFQLMGRLDDRFC